MIKSAAGPFKRMYTVLPPPENYKTELLKSVPQTQLETTNSDKDPTGKTILNLFVMCTMKLEEIHNMGFHLIQSPPTAGLDKYYFPIQSLA